MSALKSLYLEIEREEIIVIKLVYIEEYPHNNSNLKYWIPDHMLVVFHNLSGYDAHLFINEFGNKFNRDNVGELHYL